MAIGDIIVGVDIGTTKVATVVGEVNNFEQIETICSTSYKCSGLKKGKIINEEEISLSLEKTIRDAEDETNLKINSAYVTIPGKYVTIVQNSITKEVKDKYHNKVKILAITGVPEITFLNTAKEYNLDGLIYKDTDSESLLFSISQVLKGYTLFPDNCMYSEESEKFKELSDKEIKIIRCICEAKDRDEIAEELNITLGTLKNYISKILTKLEFDNITKLTIFCLSNGYIVPNQK